MSVASTNISQQFVMDNKTLAFTFTFAALQSEPDSIKARKLNAVNSDTYSTLVYDTDYTVVVNVEGSGGIITLVSSAGTDKLFIYRETADKQETDYADYNQFPADTLEHDLDRRTLRSQEENDGISRAVQFDISSSISGINLPTPVDDFGIKWSGVDGTMVNTLYPPDSRTTLAISAMTLSMAAATASSISSVAAASSATTAHTWESIAHTWESIAHTWASIAETQATLAASSATAAASAMMTVPVITITTTAQINMATIGNLNVNTSANIAALFAPLFSSTNANITGLTVGTLNIEHMDTVTVGSMTVLTHASIAILDAVLVTAATVTVTGIVDAAALTAGDLLVTTQATIAVLDAGLVTAGALGVTTSATIADLSVTSATITNLTVGTVQITNMDTVTVGSITVTTDATIANAAITGLSAATISNVTAATITGLTVATIGITGGEATALTVTTIGITGGVATALTITTVNIAGGFATALSVATLSNVTAATITLLTAGTITVDGSLVNPDISKSVTIESATTADSITLFKVPSACTINLMYAVVTGTSPSATWVIKHGTDRSGGGASVLTAGTITTDVTTGDTVSVFSDATIAAGSWVWLVLPAVTGTVDTLNVTLNYKMDA